MRTFIGSRRALFFVLLLVTSATEVFAAASQTAETTVPVLTLEEAVNLAVAHNRTVQIATLDVTKFKEELAQTKTKRLPMFSTYFFFSQLLAPISFNFQRGAFGNNYPGIGPIPASNTNITTPSRPTFYAFLQAAQPLTQLYKVHLGLREQQLSIDLSKQKLRGTRQETVADVRQAYYAILQSESAIETTEVSLKQYKELDRVVMERISQQAVLKSDSLQVKAQLAQQEYKIVQLKDTLQDQKEYLNDLLGRDLNIDFHTEQVPPLKDEETDMKVAQQTALAQRPELKQAEINVQQADYDRRLAKAAYIPDVSAALTYISPFNVDTVPKNIAAAGLQFNWEPFDWGRRKHAIGEKAITLEESKVQLQEVQSKVMLDVNSHFRKLEESRTLLQVAKAAQEASVEKLREVTTQYGQQAVLLRDVLQQQSAVASANDDYEKALLSFWSAKADFQKALGEE
jgi:outer membrane protein